MGRIGLTSGSGVRFDHSEHDTVLVEVCCVPNTATQEIVDSLVASLDGNDVIISATRHGSDFKMRVSPIGVAEDLARRIQLGVVVNTDDRTLTVEFTNRRLCGCTTVILPLTG